MYLMNREVEKNSTLDLTNKYLKRCLDHHSELLQELDLWTGVAELKHLVDQVSSDDTLELQALQQKGRAIIDATCNALKLAHDEQCRALNESPQTDAQGIKPRYSAALRDINYAAEYFKQWLDKKSASK